MQVSFIMDKLDNTTHIRNSLLKKTLEHSIQFSSFHRKRISPLVKKIDNISDLNILPCMSKADLKEDFQTILTENSFPYRVGMSSGTTLTDKNDFSTNTYQNIDEIQQYESLKLNLSKYINKEIIPIGIRILSPMHGRTIEPSLPGIFDFPLMMPFHYNQIVHYLKKHFKFKGYSNRVEIIIGSIRSLKHLSALLHKNNPELIGTLQLKGVYCYSDVLTKRWEYILSHSFNCEINNIYGVSEVPGSTSNICKYCNLFHVQPIVIPEVIHIDNDKDTIHQGYGELVLTPLYPYSQMTPLIRYRTGDLVEIAQTCNLAQDLTFKPIGRVSYSIFHTDGALLLPSFYLYEILDDTVEINRSPSLGLERFQLGPIIGAPIYDMQITKNECTIFNLDIELNFAPFLFPDVANRVANELKVKIIEYNEFSKKSYKNGSYIINLNLHSPGSLNLNHLGAH